ncbi:MAG: transporter [Rhodospirillales bacterium]|nr:transporter [Rhodospirillales bacterium]
MSIATELPAQTAADAPARPSGDAYSWFVVLFLMVLLTSSFIDRTILSLLVKPIRQDLHLTDTEFSYLAGLAFVLLYTTTGIPLGWLADRWSRRWLIAGGVAVWSVMTASCGLAGSFWRLFASRIGVGIGEATLSPCSYALISELFPPERRARPLSVFTLGIPIGSGMALMIGGSVIEAISKVGPIDLPLIGVTRPWQTVFLIVGLPGLVLALLALLIVRETPQRLLKTADDQPSFGAVLAFIWQHLGVYATLALSLGCFAIYGYGGNAWLPTYLQRVHGFTAPQAGLFLGSSVLVLGVLGSVAAGWFADRMMQNGRRDAFAATGISYAIGMVVTASLGTVITVPWLSLTLVALSGFFSLTWAGANIATLQTVTPVRMRGQVSATYLFFTNIIGLGIGPTTIAASTDYIFHRDSAVGWSIALVGTISMVLAVLILWIGRGAVARRMAAVKG